KFRQPMIVGDLSIGHLPERVRQTARVEDLGQPPIQRFDDQLLTDVDGTRVSELVDLCVLPGEDAAVMRLAVVPTALHAPPADAAEEQTSEDIRARCTPRLAGILSAPRS